MGDSYKVKGFAGGSEISCFLTDNVYKHLEESKDNNSTTVIQPQ
jgi:hypothetical protein